MYNFFAYLGRMKYIKRWALMRSTVSENIMEHSAEVGMIAHALAVISNKHFGGTYNAERIGMLGLYHETSEVITGDLPTPVKYYNPEIRDAYKQIEDIANRKLIAMLPEDIQQEYSSLIYPNENELAILKAADKLSAHIKCIEEVKSGNSEFKKALKSTKETLEQSPLPEVSYFMKHFLPAYSKTLDELD